jgi:hypothetical protein
MMGNLLTRTILPMLILAGILWNCKSSSTISTTSTQDNQVDKNPENNLVVVDSDDSISRANSKDEIIFEGTNNLFELIQKNSAYFDESHDVIVIKGNNTIVRLVNVNVLDLSEKSSDTLVIVGDNERYVVDISNSISTKNRTVKTDVEYLKDKTFDQSPYASDFAENDTKISLDYFDSLVTARYAYNYFSERLSTGDPIYFYELAEMYLYGLGVDESAAKAIDLYEYAAVRNQVQSLTKLGDIFTGAFGVKSNKGKALYYYQRCSGLGNQYCEDQITKLLNK